MDEELKQKIKQEGDSRDFKYRNIECAILRYGLGHLCGYARVPSDHPFYQKYNKDVEVIAVHGGITHVGVIPGHDGWWIGFDCMHVELGDVIPYADPHPQYQSHIKPSYKDIDYVQNQIMLMVDQMLKKGQAIT